MIQQVGEGGFEAEAQAFGEMEVFREASGDGRCARAEENPDTAVADRAGGNGIEGTDVEHADASGDVAIAGAIGPLERTAERKIEVAGIVAGLPCGPLACGCRGWREVRAGFPEADSADRPAAEGEIGSSIHV